MIDARREIIERSHDEQAHRCARCGYALGGVPIGKEGEIVCPECGYEMRFEIRVRLVAQDPEYDKLVRSRLSRFERLLITLAIIILGCVLSVLIVLLSIRT